MKMTRRTRAAAIAATILVIGVAGSQPGAADEPSYAVASKWWPDQPQQWLGVGWPKCPDEFVILWNGNVRANSYVKATGQLIFEHRLKIGDTGSNDSQAHMLFAVGDSPDFGTWWDDDGQMDQSLRDGYLPIVTTTRKVSDGTVTLQSFADRLHGEETDCLRGDRMDERPVVLWTRVIFTPNAKASHKPTKFWLALNELDFDFSGDTNSFKRPVRPYAPMDKSLQPQWFRPSGGLSKNGRYLMDGNGVRLVVQGSANWFYQKQMKTPRSANAAWLASARDHLLTDVVTVELTEQNGFEAVIAYPGTYVTPATAAQLKAVNVDNAISTVAKFWEHRVSAAPAMHLDVPEPELGAMMQAGIIQLLSALREQDGSFLLPLGILTYPWTGGWATASTETMEQLMYGGHFAEAESMLDYYYSLKLTAQDADALGPAYRAMWEAGKLNGMLSETGHYLIWVTNHGALMKAISDYYLLTRDEAFLTRWLPRLLGGLEWLRTARQFSGGQFGFPGLMPPGRTTDGDSGTQTAFGEAYTYWGFARAVHLLKSINHPEASRWERELADYRARLLELMRSEVPKYGRWTDDAGNSHPFVPSVFGVYKEATLHPVPGIPARMAAEHPSNEMVHKKFGNEYKLGFYPDTGPQTWGAVGIFDPNDPLLDETLQFLSAGSRTSGTVPMMRHGLTMMEPAYSWDIPTYFRKGDKDKFLEGFYSCAVRCFHRKNFHPVEYHFKNFTYSTWVTFTRSLRNMLVTERFDNEHSTLDVFKASPSSWFQSPKGIRIDNAPTEFGPVSIAAKARVEEGAIEIDISSPTRNPPDEILVHVPLPVGKRLKTVTVNDQPNSTHDAESIRIDRPLPEHLHIVAFTQ